MAETRSEIGAIKFIDDSSCDDKSEDTITDLIVDGRDGHHERTFSILIGDTINRSPEKRGNIRCKQVICPPSQQLSHLETANSFAIGINMRSSTSPKVDDVKSTSLNQSLARPSLNKAPEGHGSDNFRFWCQLFDLFDDDGFGYISRSHFFDRILASRELTSSLTHDQLVRLEERLSDPKCPSSVSRIEFVSIIAGVYNSESLEEALDKIDPKKDSIFRRRLASRSRAQSSSSIRSDQGRGDSNLSLANKSGHNHLDVASFCSPSRLAHPKVRLIFSNRGRGTFHDTSDASTSIRSSMGHSVARTSQKSPDRTNMKDEYAYRVVHSDNRRPHSCFLSTPSILHATGNCREDASRSSRPISLSPRVDGHSRSAGKIHCRLQNPDANCNDPRIDESYWCQDSSALTVSNLSKCEQTPSMVVSHGSALKKYSPPYDRQVYEFDLDRVSSPNLSGKGLPKRVHKHTKSCSESSAKVSNAQTTEVKQIPAKSIPDCNELHRVTAKATDKKVIISIDRVHPVTIRNSTSQTIEQKLATILAGYFIKDHRDRFYFVDEFSICPPFGFLSLLTFFQIFIFYINQLYSIKDLSTRHHVPRWIPYTPILVFMPDTKNYIWPLLSHILVLHDIKHLVYTAVVQCTLGWFLDMVHGSKRIATLYLVATLACSMCMIVIMPTTNLFGCTSGLNALLFAYLSFNILNANQMSKSMTNIYLASLLISIGVGLSIYDAVVISFPIYYMRVETVFISHVCGALVGITMGLVILRNFNRKLRQDYWWNVVAIGYGGLIVVWSIFFFIGMKNV